MASNIKFCEGERVRGHGFDIFLKTDIEFAVFKEVNLWFATHKDPYLFAYDDELTMALIDDLWRDFVALWESYVSCDKDELHPSAYGLREKLEGMMDVTL